MIKNGVSIFKNKKDLYLNFKNNNDNCIIITGIPGSGKSTLANKMIQKSDYYKISLDIVLGYEHGKITELERELLNKFKKKYPEWNYNLFNQKNYNDFYKYINLFYNFITKEYIVKNINLILEGSYFLNYININEILNKKIIIKRTSYVTSCFRRYKRTIRFLRKELEVGNITKLEYKKNILPTIKQSTIKQLKWYKLVNTFIAQISDN